MSADTTRRQILALKLAQYADRETGYIYADEIDVLREASAALASAPDAAGCDCHLHEHQVCDICQGVAAPDAARLAELDWTLRQGVADGSENAAVIASALTLLAALVSGEGTGTP